jgi:hypothetical protein
MKLSKKSLKAFFGIDALNQHLDEVEEYLEQKTEQLDNILKRKRNKDKKTKVDSQWVIKTASSNLKRSIRKISRHM